MGLRFSTPLDFASITCSCRFEVLSRSLRYRCVGQSYLVGMLGRHRWLYLSYMCRRSTKHSNRVLRRIRQRHNWHRRRNGQRIARSPSQSLSSIPILCLPRTRAAERRTKQRSSDIRLLPIHLRNVDAGNEYVYLSALAWGEPDDGRVEQHEVQRTQAVDSILLYTD